MSIFDKAAGDGIVELIDDSIHAVVVIVSDVAGNESQLQFNIQRDSSIYFNANFYGQAGQKMAPYHVEIFENKEVQMVLDEAALYDTVLLRYSSSAAAFPYVSALHSIGDYRIPVHDSFTLRIKPNANLPDSIKNKTVMVIRSGQKNDAQRCTWRGSWAQAKWWNFGQFSLKYDAVRPTLKPVNVYDSATFVKDQRLVFDAYDETGDLPSFNGYIDGKWVIFRQKDNRYTYDFDDRCLPGWHLLEVKVKDLAGNESSYTCNFYNGRMP